MEHIKVVNNSETKGWFGTEVFVGEHKISGARSVDFRVAMDEVPVFTIETLGEPDIEMDGDIVFKFHPETIKEACEVIRKSFSGNNDNYEALVASIESAIAECEDEYEMARDIANRILGIEK